MGAHQTVYSSPGTVWSQSFHPSCYAQLHLHWVVSPGLAPPSRLQHAGVPGRGGEKMKGWREGKEEKQQYDSRGQTQMSWCVFSQSWGMYHKSLNLSVPKGKFLLCVWTTVELQPSILVLHFSTLLTVCSWDFLDADECGRTLTTCSGDSLHANACRMISVKWKSVAFRNLHL